MHMHKRAQNSIKMNRDNSLAQEMPSIVKGGETDKVQRQFALW